MVKKFLYLNGLAIVAVILFHAAGWGFTALFPWAHRYAAANTAPFANISSLAYLVLRFIEQLSMFSISFFLFVSGYFVAFNTPASAKTIAWKSILNRIKFLAIPYLLWTVLFIIANTLQGRPLPDIAGLLRIFLTGSITPAYYFVILLIQFYLLAPFLVPLAQKHWKTLLLVSAILQISFHLLQYLFILQPESAASQLLITIFPKWLFVVRLFWFSFGLVIGIHRAKFTRFFEGKTAVWAGLAVLFFILGFFEWELLLKWSGTGWVETRETLIDALYAFSLLAALLGTVKALPLRSPVEKIGGQSYGIYLAHVPVMEYLARGIYHLIPPLLGQTLLFAFIIASGGLAIPLLIMWIFRKTFLKRIYGYVFG